MSNGIDQEVFNQALMLAAHLVERKEPAYATIVLRPWIDTPLADDLKAIVCINLAVCATHQGDDETTLAWYDHGMTYAHVLCAENKAAWLAGRGRNGEALAVYESLMPELLSPEERHRVSHNIATLRGR